MRSSGQDSQRRYDGEQGECYQTESVKNHRCKLPITFNCCGLLVITDLVCNHFNFFQNETQFSGHPRGVGGGGGGVDVLFTGRHRARDPRKRKIFQMGNIFRFHFLQKHILLNGGSKKQYWSLIVIIFGSAIKSFQLMMQELLLLFSCGSRADGMSSCCKL